MAECADVGIGRLYIRTVERTDAGGDGSSGKEEGGNLLYSGQSPIGTCRSGNSCVGSFVPCGIHSGQGGKPFGIYGQFRTDRDDCAGGMDGKEISTGGNAEGGDEAGGQRGKGGRCSESGSEENFVVKMNERAKELGIYRASQLEREKLGAQLGETLAPLGWEETLIRLLRARIVYDWDVNSKDSPLRLGSDGLFLFWPDVCPILINDLAQRGLTGLPNDPDLWAGLFLKEGITEPSHRNQAVLLIAVTPNAKPRQAIKLNHKLFATHEKILLTKIPKRSFEVTDLSFTQETALSELNRQMLETLDDAFRTDSPAEIQATPKRLYQFQSKKELTPELQNALDVLFERLTTNPILIQKHLIDEGLLVTEALLTGISDLSPNLLIMQLHTEALIENTSKGEPRFVEHHPTDGSTIRGVILKPCHIASVFLNGTERQKNNFSETFKAIFHRSPQPIRFEVERSNDNPQLSLNLESDE